MLSMTSVSFSQSSQPASGCRGRLFIAQVAARHDKTQMPFNDLTIMWIRYFGIAGAQHSNGRKFEVSNSSGLSCSSLVGNPHWRIPNSSVRTNSSETRRSLSLSLKKLTELYEISNGFTRKDWVGVGFELSITWKVFPQYYLDPL